MDPGVQERLLKAIYRAKEEDTDDDVSTLPLHRGLHWCSGRLQDAAAAYKMMTGHRGFRPGAIQIGLYSHRSRIEA